MESPKKARVEDTKNKLFASMDHSAHSRPRKKVSVVGVGAVGMAAAYSILNQGLCSDLVLVDVLADKVRGEVMDLNHGRAFAKGVSISGGTDYELTKNSQLVIITAGVRQKPGESRLSLVGRNLDIFRKIVPDVVKYSPDTVILVVSNPVDIMTWVAYKLSGFPPGRVFGSGTALDSSRFRALIADRLEVDTRSVHGYILGEHGDSSVPIWSELNVGGVRLKSLTPDLGEEKDTENWSEIHTKVVKSAYEVIDLKGYTSWAIGITAASITEAVLRDEARVMPVSVCVKGKYGIEEDVYLSLPAVVGGSGVHKTLSIPLSESEQGRLQKSAHTIWDVQKELDV